MIRIEANTLEEAYSKAATELNCSVTQITFEVIQNPSSGFLGMFKKSAIIEAKITGSEDFVQKSEEKPKKSKNRRNRQKKKEHKEDKKSTSPVKKQQDKQDVKKTQKSNFK